MNLYLVINKSSGYDTLRSAVVAAQSEEDAVELVSEEFNAYSSFFCKSVELIAENTTKPYGWIHGDFLNG